MKKIRGVITALVTPFDRQRNVDFKSLEKIVKDQLSRGVQGFVINGTTAESPTLDEAEVQDIWQLVRSIAGEKIPLILGTGSNSTEKTIKETQKAKDWGADAALVVVPYYNKPPQRGLLQHFKKIAEQTQAPLLLYNVPGRTALNMSAETVVELSNTPNIIGIKDATGDMETAKQIAQRAKDGFIKLSGDDGTYAEYLENGGQGIISVGSHVVPEVFLKISQFVAEKKLTEARALQFDYKALVDSFYLESNPIPIKKALELAGLLSTAQMRLPLVEASEETTEKLRFLMREKSLIK